tara:strand:- start:171 stop:1613 length:1443 start_codon:yes stop_codon:yes gene_type:complete
MGFKMKGFNPGKGTGMERTLHAKSSAYKITSPTKLAGPANDKLGGGVRRTTGTTQNRVATRNVGRGGAKITRKVNNDGRQAEGGVKMGGKYFGERMVKPAPTKLVKRVSRVTGNKGKTALMQAGARALLKQSGKAKVIKYPSKGRSGKPTKAVRARYSSADSRPKNPVQAGIDSASPSPQKVAGGLAVRVGSKLLPAVFRGGTKTVAKNVAKNTAKNAAKTVTYAPVAAAKTTGQKLVSGLKSGAKYMVGGYAFDKALSLMFPGKKAEDLTEKQKGGVAAAAAKGAKFAADKAKKGSQANAYDKAAKRDPKLAKFVAERNKHPKGSEAYNAAQNRINRAYGSKKRHGVTKTTATKGRTTVTRGRTPGIGERAKMTKDRAIGGRKQVDHAKSYITGKSKERKVKKDAGKIKERFYDAQGNLEKKVKMKGEGKNLRKVKVTKKTDTHVTKTKKNFRTGKVRTKTRKRRLVGLGDKLAGLVGR